mmetsp:Transcript_9276/g.24724  ORF Transcript_9276/g.24724 Transcript_9276/m.24724 type:complete len:247 (-) Transcript_9276:206-946(-)
MRLVRADKCQTTSDLVRQTPSSGSMSWTGPKEASLPTITASNTSRCCCSPAPSTSSSAALSTPTDRTAAWGTCSATFKSEQRSPSTSRLHRSRCRSKRSALREWVSSLFRLVTGGSGSTRHKSPDASSHTSEFELTCMFACSAPCASRNCSISSVHPALTTSTGTPSLASRCSISLAPGRSLTGASVTRGSSSSFRGAPLSTSISFARSHQPPPSRGGSKGVEKSSSGSNFLRTSAGMRSDLPRMS